MIFQCLTKVFCLFFILLGFNYSKASASVDDFVGFRDSSSENFFLRCSESFNHDNKRDSAKEIDIYNSILELSKEDVIVNDLLYKAGRIPKMRSKKMGKRTVYTIPVIFHMFLGMQGGIEKGNIPEESIVKQISLANKAFKKTGIRFKLEEIYTYKNSPYYLTCENKKAEMKTKHGIETEKYLNIFICSPTILGGTEMPWSFSENSKLHGVILNNIAFPAVPGYFPNRRYNEGDTFIHEVGHFLGLYHTFEGGCDGVGDEISDTPAEAEWGSGRDCLIQPPKDTCASKGVDPVRNYMNYVDDFCMTHFTPLQHARMRTMFLKYKKVMSGQQPSKAPTMTPTNFPSKRPTKSPSLRPSESPTTAPKE